MLTNERLVELYGRLPLGATVRAEGEDDGGWWIETPCLVVPGTNPTVVLMQGGIHSPGPQLLHKVRRFVEDGFRVVCLDQWGAPSVSKSANFLKRLRCSRLVVRDLKILDYFGVDKVICYGSSIGAAASIALADEAPSRVAAVIAVNPSSLIRQNPWWLTAKFAISFLQKVEKDFEPPPTPPLTMGRVLNELKEWGAAADIAAGGWGLDCLSRTKCPVLIYTGKQDILFPWRKLKALEGRRYPNVQVIVLDNFIHSDPNSRRKIDLVVTDAMRRLGIR